eukprot:TCONS_00044479-protein
MFPVLISLVLVISNHGCVTPIETFISTITATAPPSTIKYAKSRTNYYSNSTATFSIVLSGDIETNPGPTAPNNKPKCTVCSKTVGTNRKRFECEICFSMTHITCSEISKAQQKHYNAIKPYSWICSNCFCSELPFYKERELPIHKVMNPNPVQDIIDPHIEVLQNHKNRISIGHLNTQSLLPSLGEFSIVVNKYNLDIYTISESWLQNNEKQISLAELEGYKLFYKNRVGKRGGGVAIYVKDTITRHERKDITKNHKDLEVVIVEAKGKNKNNSYLIVTVYQPSSKEEDKLLWL